MKIRRCAVLYIESREQLAVDWQALFAGTSTMAASMRWLALLPHLEREVELDTEALLALGTVSQTIWRERGALLQQMPEAVLERLLAQGLLIGDTPEHAALRARDELLRATHWRPMSALAHTFSRWHDVRAETGMHAPSFQELLDTYGEPPPSTFDLGSAAAALKLPPVARGPLDEVLFQRYTGRNFDLQATLPLPLVARLLQRTFGAQEVRAVGPHAEVVKKTSPSGGGLHPVEAFVLAQRVDGVLPGLYHYHPLAHELRPLRTMERAEAAALAGRVADKLDYVGVLTLEFFATEDGPVFNEMAPRVHNSGHWTIEGAVASQFENHIRAICGLPLGDTGLTAARVEMENLIGEDAERWAAILAEPGAHLHLYGKAIRPGRKMGHVTRLTR